MEKFINRIDETHTDRTDQDGTELLLIKMCREATGKEERLVSACVCPQSRVQLLNFPRVLVTVLLYWSHRHRRH